MRPPWTRWRLLSSFELIKLISHQRPSLETGLETRSRSGI
jgi:hypothetical protein